jgi:hypothetical protein
MAKALKPGAIFVTFTKGLNLSRHFEVLERKRYKMSWGPATVFIHRRLNDDGSSVGGFRLNLLPSDDHSYSDTEDEADKQGVFQPDDDDNNDDEDDEDEDEDDEDEDGGNMYDKEEDDDDDDEYDDDDYDEYDDEEYDEDDDDDEDEDGGALGRGEGSQKKELYNPGRSFASAPAATSSSASDRVPTSASGSPLQVKVTPLSSK